jgi:hypothetical protein
MRSCSSAVLYGCIQAVAYAQGKLQYLIFTAELVNRAEGSGF